MVKVGVGVIRESFDGHTVSAPIVIVRADGSRAGQVDFWVPRPCRVVKTDLQAFVQDVWSAGDRLTLDYGVRYDWDGVAETHHVVPRVGFSFLPTPGGRTVLRGGAGLFYDKLTLNATSFDQLPARTVTRDLADGVSLAGPANIQRLVVDGGRLRNPESVAWSLELDARKFFRHTWPCGSAINSARGRASSLSSRPPLGPVPRSSGWPTPAAPAIAELLEFTGRYVTGPSQLVRVVRPNHRRSVTSIR